MYTAFNVILDNDFLFRNRKYIDAGKMRHNELSCQSKQILEKYTSSDGIVDGTELSDEWFRTFSSDIFISHSHNDAELAYALSGWLQDTFHLNVFMDEVVWGSADELLRSIDNKYCWDEKNNFYNYSKRNLTTSHVHAMLSSAIYNVMDKTEVIFFLNTQESIPQVCNVLKENSNYTLSPWIYQELTATKLLRVREWYEHRQQYLIEHSFQKHDSKDIRIAYKTPVSDMLKLNEHDLTIWQYQYHKENTLVSSKKDLMEGNHPLNILYDYKLEKRN